MSEGEYITLSGLKIHLVNGDVIESTVDDREREALLDPAAVWVHIWDDTTVEVVAVRVENVTHIETVNYQQVKREDYEQS